MGISNNREAIACFISPSDVNHPGFASARYLAKHTISVLAKLTSVDKVVYTDPAHAGWLEEIIPDDESFTLRLTGPHGTAQLTEKVQNAFQSLFHDGYERVLAVGADTPGLSESLLRSSLRDLRRNDSRAVVGPSRDGGFYLLGLQSIPDNLFEDVPFFSSNTYDSLVNQLGRVVNEIVTLRKLTDIDTVLDWLGLNRDELFGPCIRAFTKLQLLQLNRQFEKTYSKLKSYLVYLQRTSRAPPFTFLA